ncbi:hypothetical protein ACFQ1I_25420 [Kitasatospora arboriphila]
MFRTASRHTVVDTVSDPTVAAAIQQRLDAAFTAENNGRFGLDAEGRAPKGLTFVSRTVPVGTRTTNYADTATTVEVWCTGLHGLAGDGSTRPVSQDWYTLTVTMRWTGSDWKVTDFDRASGPAPFRVISRRPRPSRSLTQSRGSRLPLCAVTARPDPSSDGPVRWAAHSPSCRPPR